MSKWRVVFALISKTKNGAGGIMIDEEGEPQVSSSGDLLLHDADGLRAIYARGKWEHVYRLKEGDD